MAYSVWHISAHIRLRLYGTWNNFAIRIICTMGTGLTDWFVRTSESSQVEKRLYANVTNLTFIFPPWIEYRTPWEWRQQDPLNRSYKGYSVEQRSFVAVLVQRTYRGRNAARMCVRNIMYEQRNVQQELETFRTAHSRLDTMRMRELASPVRTARHNNAW